MEQIALQWNAGPRVLTVTQLTEAIRDLLDEEFGLVWVSGEISGCRVPSSGHFYFRLKDEGAQLDAVCYKSTARFLKFKPKDGVAVIARGRLDVYPPRGNYQFVVETLEPQGYGALQFAFEQLKKKLAMEGLFEAGRKRPLPKLPMRIGLVTSPTGAVIQDMLNILERRFPGLHIRLFPALVQGEGSVEAVCRGIEYFSRSGWADVVIVARGGGSLEDLWTFNEEAVARAIAASSVPVIAAIGHETDFTIADFVADLRAPTPSAAAELVVCERQKLLEQIAAFRHKLEQSARYRIAQAARVLHEIGVDRVAAGVHRGIGRRMQRIDELEYQMRESVRREMDGAMRRWRGLDARLRPALGLTIQPRKERVYDLTARLERQNPLSRLANAARRLESADAALVRAMRLRAASARAELEALASDRLRAALERRLRSIQRVEDRVEAAAARLSHAVQIRIAAARGRHDTVYANLTQLSPLRILKRGYAIVKTGGILVKSASDAPAGSALTITIAEGELGATSTGPVDPGSAGR